MADHNSSSTSSSEHATAAGLAPGLTLHRVVVAGALALLGLVAVDLVMGRLFAMPPSPLSMPTALQRYFDYGLSVEGKLRRMTGSSDADTAMVAKAGWLNEQVVEPQSIRPEKVRVVVYGQSFAFQIAEALQRQDDRFQTIAKLGGPSAPLSHSHAAYTAANATESGTQIVLFGILASSLPRLVSLTNTTTWFESPAPFTYPRYRLEKGKLAAVNPRVATLSDLRLALQTPALWQEFVGQLRRDDAAYNAWVFESDIMDYSTLGRLLRRGYGQRHWQQVDQRYHLRSGFTNTDHLLDITRAILADIARIAAERGQIPCILLIHDRGFDDHLATALGPFLEKAQIPYFSSHRLAPVSDARNFLVDGHFTSAVNEKLALGLRGVLLERGIVGAPQSE